MIFLGPLAHNNIIKKNESQASEILLKKNQKRYFFSPKALTFTETNIIYVPRIRKIKKMIKRTVYNVGFAWQGIANNEKIVFT
jgi:hypothetical protein